MKPILTRAERRRMLRHAEKIGAMMAARSLKSDGRAGIVCNPTARKLLAQGYTELIRNDCKPVVQRITEAQAAALPGYCPTPAGATWWVAFGLDVDSRGTWVTRWAKMQGLSIDDARDAVEVRLLADLARACNVRGFPVMEGYK